MYHMLICLHRVLVGKYLFIVMCSICVENSVGQNRFFLETVICKVLLMIIIIIVNCFYQLYLLLKKKKKYSSTVVFFSFTIIMSIVCCK